MRTGRRSGASALPIVGGGIHDHALHGGGAAVARRGGGGAIVPIWNGDRPAVRIEQHLGWIEAHPAPGIRRALDAKAVELARRHAGDEHVPVVIGSVLDRIDADHAGGLGLVHVIEEEQLDAGGVSREHGEVHPRRVSASPPAVTLVPAEPGVRNLRGGVTAQAARGACPSS